MQYGKISFDFSDQPKLINMLRLHASRVGLSQKEIVARALEAYFAHEAESAFLLDAARCVRFCGVFSAILFRGDDGVTSSR